MSTALRERMISDMQVRHLSHRTIGTYIYHVAKFAAFFHKAPDELGPEDIRRYQVYLVEEKKVGWATFNQTVCALRFLYRVTLHKHWSIPHIPYSRKERVLPVVLSLEEVGQLLQAIASLKYRAVLTTTYSAGLRLSEVISLRVSDIDSSRMLIRVRQGKGRKDRYVMLSPVLLELLRRYWRAARPTDYLFPGQKKDQHLTASSVQKACRRAAEASGLQKHVSVHTLRHCFATHLLEAGADIRQIQLLMGHTTPRTTEIYTHVSPQKAQKLTSPLDSVPTLASPLVATPF
jgi:integrase/recombinase XerD